MNQMTLNRGNNMAEAYEQMVLSKAQSDKDCTASSIKDDWKTTTHSANYEVGSD
jgi:hypothetical protein